MSSSFIFINRGRALKDEKNINILRNSFHRITTNNKIELLKSCLFVINMFGDLKEDERDKNKLKNDIVEYLFVDDENKNFNLIEKTNVTFFDAKAYKEYLREEKFFTDIDYFLNYLYNNFMKKNDNIFNNISKNENFINFCLNEIETKIENDTFENKKRQKIKFYKEKKYDIKIYEKLEKYIH